MTEIYVTQGKTNNYMGVPVTTRFYSVVHNNRLIIRTSNKQLAHKIYNEHIGVALDKSKDSIGPAVNTQDDLQAIHTTDKTKTQRS
jgi:hypothetical protein